MISKSDAAPVLPCSLRAYSSILQRGGLDGGPGVKGLETKVEVIRLRKENPGWAMTQIARLCHVSRERVRQILKGQGLPTKRPSPNCKACGKRLLDWPKFGLCKDCRKKSHLRELQCEWCHVKFLRPTYVTKGKHQFCSRDCLGKWAGATHGLGSPNRTSAQAKLLLPHEYCDRSHPLSGTNLLVYGGRRVCRACTHLRRALKKAKGVG